MRRSGQARVQACVLGESLVLLGPATTANFAELAFLGPRTAVSVNQLALSSLARAPFDEQKKGRGREGFGRNDLFKLLPSPRSLSPS